MTVAAPVADPPSPLTDSSPLPDSSPLTDTAPMAARAPMRILVTGGAGYVGSVTVEQLLNAGHEVTILDSLVRGHQQAVPDGVSLVTASLHDATSVEAALRSNEIEAVLHCAAFALVGESMTEPAT